MIRGSTHTIVPLLLLLRLGTSVLLLVTSALAQAPASAREQADALFERGKSALKAGDWSAACTDFRASLELDESASTLVKVARCHEHAGQLSRALADYARALELARARPASDKHARDLESLIQSSAAALETRLGKLRVLLDPIPSRVVLLVDGHSSRVVEPAEKEFVLPIDPGKHTLEIQSEAYVMTPVSVELAEKQVLDLRIELTPIPARKERSIPIAQTPTPVQPSSASPARGVAPDRSKRSKAVATPYRPAMAEEGFESRTHNGTAGGQAQRTVGYVVGGSGVVLTGMAAYFGLRTRALVNDARADNHCDNDYRCDRRGLELIDLAREEQTKAIVSGVCGGILIGTGIVLITMTGPKHRRASERSIAVALNPMGAAVGGHW